jgi:uncharacterized membrane protein YqjE
MEKNLKEKQVIKKSLTKLLVNLAILSIYFVIFYAVLSTYKLSIDIIPIASILALFFSMFNEINCSLIDIQKKLNGKNN